MTKNFKPVPASLVQALAEHGIDVDWEIEA